MGLGSAYLWSLFNTKLGVANLILFCMTPFLILFLIYAVAEEEAEKLEERELLKTIDCTQLGEMILNEEILYNNRHYADQQWNIRCHGGIEP